MNSAIKGCYNEFGTPIRGWRNFKIYEFGKKKSKCDT